MRTYLTAYRVKPAAVDAGIEVAPAKLVRADGWATMQRHDEATVIA
jgi:hypothetical protein